MTAVASRRSPCALHRPTASFLQTPRPILAGCFATSSYSAATVQDVIIQQRKSGLPLGKHSLPYPPHLLRLKQRRIRPKQVERDPSKRAPLKHRTSKSRAEIIADAMKVELRRSETAAKETRGREWTDARLRAWNEHREYFEARMARGELERRTETLRFAARYCNEAARIGVPEAGRRAYARAQEMMLDDAPEEFDAIAKTYRDSRAEFDGFNEKVAEDSNIQVLDKLHDIRGQLEALEEEIEPLEQLYPADPKESASHKLEKDEQFKELMELRRERDELYTRAKALKMALQIASMKPHVLAETAASEILENIRSPPKGVWPEDTPIGQASDNFQIRMGKVTQEVGGVTINQVEEAADPAERKMLLETAAEAAGLFPYTFEDTAPRDVKDMDALATEMHATLSRKGPSPGGRHDAAPAALTRWMAAQNPSQDVPERDQLRFAAFRFAALSREARFARREFGKFADAYEREHRDALRKLHLWTYRLPVRAFDWEAADEALDVHIAGNEYAPARPSAAMELASTTGAKAEPAVKQGEDVVLYAAPKRTGPMTAAVATLGAAATATGSASAWILAEGWATLPLAATGMEAMAAAFSAAAVWFAYCTRLRYVHRVVVRRRETAAGPVLHATVTGRGYLPFTTKEVEALASELRMEYEYDETRLDKPRRPAVPYASMNPVIRPLARLRGGFLEVFDAVSWYIGRRYLKHLWTEEGQSRKFSAWWLDRRGFYNQRLNCECVVCG